MDGDFRNELIHYIKLFSLKIAGPGESFTLKSGQKSNYYLDCRELNLRPDGLHTVVSGFWEKLKSHRVDFDAFGGPCIGADPIIGGLLYSTWSDPFSKMYRGFLIRKESKSHGITDRLVGPLKKDDRCVIIEDVVTTGQSSLDAIQVVEAFGAKVVHVMCVVDRLMGGGELFQDKGYPFTSLLTINDFDIPKQIEA